MKNHSLFLLPLLTITLTSCSVDEFLDLLLGNSCNEFSYSEPELTSLENTLTKTQLKYDLGDYAKRSMYNIPNLKSTGDTNILVIPVWFSDSSNFVSENKKEKIKNDIQIAYFGSNSETGWRSVNTYYQEDSYGRLNISGKVTDWYTTSMRGSTMNDTSVDILVENATNWYKSNNNDIRKFDSDSDGYIDCVCLIYAYPNSYNDNDTLWAYTYWLQDSSLCSIKSPGPNTYFWASYDFMYDGAGDTSHCKIDAHTYIHEMGHVLGLDDYYDYACSSSYFNAPAGGFSMQDYNVGDHDPLSKLMLGWSEPYVPTDSCTINIHNFQESGECIILSPSFTGSPFDEYIILELYTSEGLNSFDTTYRWGGNKSGYPKGPSNIGIRIWHADSRLIYLTSDYDDFSENKVSSTLSSDKWYTFGMSNTTYSSSTKDYCSPIKSFQKYNLLQLLRNNTTASYAKGINHTAELIKNADLWTQGSTFSMAKYKTQFYNSGKLNSKISLGFEVNIKYVSKDYATIEVTKI